MTRYSSVILLLLLCAVGMRAQDHCPLNGQTKSGGNPSISWTSYMVKTDTGICVERTVRTQSQTYVNWPAADINGVFVDRIWTIRRCCFVDSTVKDGDLEYGVLGSKLHTTVYQGYNETPQRTSLMVDGTLVSGNKSVPVKFEVASLPETAACEAATGTCQKYTFIVSNHKNALFIYRKHRGGKVGIAGPPTWPVWPGGKSDEFVLNPGKSVTVELLSKSDKPGDGWISLSTADGRQLLVKQIPDVADKR